MTPELVIGGLTAAFALGLIALFVTLMRQNSRDWAALAGPMGLTLTPGGAFAYPTLSGTWRGEEVTLDVVMRGGRQRVPFTRARLTLPGAPEDLALRPQSGAMALAKALGAQDLTVGDAAFDAAFVVTAQDPAAAQAWLADDARRAALLALTEACPGVFLSRGQLGMARRGFTRARPALEADLEALVGAKGALNE